MSGDIRFSIYVKFSICSVFHMLAGQVSEVVKKVSVPTHGGWPVYFTFQEEYH